MDYSDFKVRLADWERDEPALREVRTSVFVKEQAVSEREEWDGLDAECTHAVAENAAQGVFGTGRLHPSGKIGRMAVLPEWRGQGVGAAILRRLLEEATNRGLESVYLHAQVQVLGFYSRFGFVAEGEEFEEANIPHRLMRLRLPRGGTGLAAAGEQTGTRRVLSGKREFAAAVADVAAVAARSLAIFTPDLEHGIYDTKPFLETVKRLVLSRSHARIRVLVSDPDRVQLSVNRFLHVGRRLSTFIEFRRLAESFQERGDAFLVADNAALVYRARADRWEGVADTREPRMARRYLGEFDQMWQHSETAQEIGELRI
ncbi:MAG TPA: GNAT family N-acetyltransferase [Gammaproteobacteria bacterium]|nr:GNAT family N-acetyltransferase [Gammaproteobacteria bacterium]